MLHDVIKYMINSSGKLDENLTLTSRTKGRENPIMWLEE